MNTRETDLETAKQGGNPKKRSGPEPFLSIPRSTQETLRAGTIDLLTLDGKTLLENATHPRAVAILLEALRLRVRGRTGLLLASPASDTGFNPVLARDFSLSRA